MSCSLCNGHTGDEGNHEATTPQADRGNQAVREVIRFKARKLRGGSPESRSTAASMCAQVDCFRSGTDGHGLMASDAFSIRESARMLGDSHKSSGAADLRKALSLRNAGFWLLMQSLQLRSSRL